MRYSFESERGGKMNKSEELCQSPILSAEGNMLDEDGNLQILIEDRCMFQSRDPEEETKSSTLPLLTQKVGQNDYNTFFSKEDS